MGKDNSSEKDRKKSPLWAKITRLKKGQKNVPFMAKDNSSEQDRKMSSLQVKNKSSVNKNSHKWAKITCLEKNPTFY